MRLLLLYIVAGVICRGTDVSAAQDSTPVEQLTAEAAVAGVASVESMSARVNSVNNMVYTDFVLKFSDVWKGDPGDPFILTKVGGRLDGRTVSVPGHEFALNVGETIAVFALKNQFGDYITLGIHDGMFRIDPNGDHVVHRVVEPKSERLSPMTLAALREKVFRASGRPWTEPPKLIVPAKTSKPFGAAAPDPTIIPSASSSLPRTGPESGRSSLGIILVGLVILAAVVAVFILRKSKAEPDHSR